MNCREFADFLDLYFEGELPPEQRAVFDEHLAECPACRSYLDGYRKTVFALKTVARIDPAETAPKDLIRAILAARGE